MVTREAIDNAAERIGRWVRRTPVMTLEPDAFGVEGVLSLKLELFQHTGSFKPRGAFNRMLSVEVPEVGVITASGGNHGQAVAYAARELGHPAEIFVPETSPPLKAERMRRFGAEVNVGGRYYYDAMQACLRRAAETGALMVHPYDQAEIVAGQGTVGKELSEQLPELATVLVAVGGGGLAAGIAAWYAGSIRVITVEPETCPTMASAREAGRPVDVEVGGIAADSLAARCVGKIPFEVAREFVDACILVEDEAIAAAQAQLWDKLRVLSEPGGAASLAALTSGAYIPEAGAHVCAVICGGNTSTVPHPNA